MNKKITAIIAALLAIVMSLTLSACGGKQEDVKGKSSEAVSGATNDSADKKSGETPSGSTDKKSGETTSGSTDKKSSETPSAAADKKTSENQSSAAQKTTQPATKSAAAKSGESTPKTTNPSGENIAAKPLLETYEAALTKMMTNKTPFGDDILNTVFEYKFGKADYKNTIKNRFSETSGKLLSVYTKSSFTEKFGNSPVASLNVRSYRTIKLDDTELSKQANNLDMPKIEDIKKYSVITNISNGSKTTRWSSTDWCFAKVNGTWYMVLSDTDL